MKHISAYFDNVEKTEEKFAWWPVRSSFNKKRLIWLKKYVVVHIYYDDMGRPPIKGRSWSFIYTKNEYLTYLLRKNENEIY